MDLSSFASNSGREAGPRRLISLAIVAGALVLLLAGTALAESIRCPGSGGCNGTAENDIMRGGPGNDKMVGGGGKDKMYGGAGRDRVKGKRAADLIEGGDGNDIVKGESGRDFVRGGPGDDVVRGASHSRPGDGVRDVLDCGTGTDTVYFVRGEDSVRNCEVFNPPEA